MATPAANSVIDPTAVPSNLDEAVRGLLQGGSWQFSGPRTLSYSLHSDSALAFWTEPKIAAVDRAFAAWAAVANVRFQRVSGPPDYRRTAADLALTLSKDLASAYPGAMAVGVSPDPAYANTLLAGLGTNRFSYPRPEGDIFFNAFSTELSYSSAGGAGFAVGLHEIGHALGLKHPFDDGGNVRPTFAALGIGALDNGLATVMSYAAPFPGSPDMSRGYQITPMALDILAIQQVYGANLSYRTGNDTYRLLNDNLVRAIWDAGGTDCIDGSALPFAVTIALTDGAMIEHGQYSRTAIAYGVTLENAIGSAYNDTLIGNAADNRLDGRAGADILSGGLGNDTYVVDNLLDTIVEDADQGTDLAQISAAAPGATWLLAPNLENATLSNAVAFNLTGNALDNILIGNAAANTLVGADGNDVLDGRAGRDTLVGGLGDDLYVVDNPGDIVSEGDAGGSDTVQASVSYTLGANLENLVLTGSAAINGIGNDGVNVLTGNAAANLLDGGAGADTLVGGAGGDTYVVDDAGDTVVETAAPGGGIDTVRASVDCILGANLENLTLTGAGNLAGTGNPLRNVIVGNDGANLLDGQSGADTLRGGKGNDTYVVDLIRSRAVVALEDSVTENLNEGSDTLVLRGVVALSAATTLTLGANLENIDAGATGTTRLNLTGNAGNNLLTGNDADNLLNGGLGNDTLLGGAGNDTLLTGGGNDVFSGGTGSDSFVIERVGSLVAAISDFEAGTDKIGLGQAAYGALFTGGALKAGVFANGAAATTATQRLFYNAGTGGLFYDGDGSGSVAAVQVATLGNLPGALAASDFTLAAGV